MRFLLLLLLSAFWVTSQSTAQSNTSFSDNYELFVKEMVEQMSASKRDDYKKLASDFSDSWNSEYIDAQRDVIMKAANDMKRKRLPIYPYFGNYLELLQKLKEHCLCIIK